jgi:hypothetical protein
MLLSATSAPALQVSGESLDAKTYRASEDVAQSFLSRALASAEKVGLSEPDCFLAHAVFVYDLCFIAKARVAIEKLPAAHPLRKLNAAEAGVLRSYMDREYQVINEALRGDEAAKVDAVALEIKLMLSGLNALPKSGKTELYRNETFLWDADAPQAEIDEVADRFVEGGNFETSAFLSTTLGTDPGAREQILDGALVLLKIRAQGAKSVAEISPRPYEQEYLYAPGTRFRVLRKAKHEVGSGKARRTAYVIDLEEIR